MLYKDMGKITRENALEQKNKKPRFKFNPGLVLISLRTTGPSVLECDKHILNLKFVYQHKSKTKKMIKTNCLSET